LTPLIGRDEEIDLLLRRWRYAAQGEGCAVVLSGDPGIGKSHIARALQERLQAEPHITLRYFCSAHHTISALFPFISQLERAALFERSDSPTQSPSSKPYSLNPPLTRTTWQFWPTCCRCHPTTATACWS
jgi:predicted ATPase